MPEPSLLQEEEMNASIEYGKRPHKNRKRKNNKVTHINEILKESTLSKLKKDNETIKNPFRIITLPSRQNTPSSGVNKELSSLSNGEVSKSPINEQSLEQEQMMKQEKQERNKECARACRQRKKIYLESIEKENRRLRKELIRYRKELSVYKSKEEAGLLSNLDSSAMITNSIEKLNISKNKESLDDHMVTYIS